MPEYDRVSDAQTTITLFPYVAYLTPGGVGSDMPALDPPTESPPDVPIDRVGRAATPQSAYEVVHARNYDVEDAHTVTVTITDDRGVQVFRRRSYLGPGQAESARRRLDPGTYKVEVVADGLDHVRHRLDIGPGPAHTALVELGNGVTSVSQGVY